MRHRVALTVLAVGWALPVVAQDTFSGKVTRIERGDQVVVQLDGWQLTVRLHGAKCPEQGVLAVIARNWTSARLEGHKVSVHVRGTAAKGVVYGDILYPPKESNISIELVEKGLATWASSYAPSRKDLAASEDRAHRSKEGIWGNLEIESKRLQAQLVALKPSATPAPVATPSASPKLQQPSAPSPAPSGKSVPAWPLVVGLLGSGGLLALAELLSREARRLRERPILLTDASGKSGPIKAKGVARSQDGSTLTSIAGNIPALYLREITESFREGAWQIIHNEVNALPFFLDDGTGQALVPVEKTVYKPIRVARFYNEIPVENWHARAYSGDARSEIFFIPPDVTVTVHGVYRADAAQFSPTGEGRTPLTVIEGDERRLTRRPLQLAAGLVVAAVVVLLLGFWFTASGAG